MGRLTREEKEIIAYNISEQRKQKYPGHGGGKKCAEEFGVPAQQWSPWESGSRTPDDSRLTQIAEFFKITVSDLRQEPETWEKIRVGWIAGKRKSQWRDMAMMTTPLLQSAISTNAQPTASLDTSASDDLMALMKLLTDSHGRIGAGELSVADYAGKVRQLLEYGRFVFSK